MDSLKLEASVTPRELADAQYLFLKTNRIMVRLFLISLVVLFLGKAWILEMSRTEIAAWVVAFLFAAAFTAAALPRLFRVIFRLLARRNEICGLPISYEFQEDRLRVSSPQGDGHVKWKAFKSWNFSDLVLIISMKQVFYMVPRRSLTEPQFEQLCKLLEEKIGKRG